MKHYSLPVEQPLRAAVGPGAEVRQGSATGSRESRSWVQHCLVYFTILELIFVQLMGNGEGVFKGDHEVQVIFP